MPEVLESRLSEEFEANVWIHEVYVLSHFLHLRLVLSLYWQERVS